MNLFRYLVAVVGLSVVCAGAQADPTVKFIYAETSSDVYDVYVRVLDPLAETAGLSTYSVIARYSLEPANAALNDAAAWSQNNMKATAGAQTAGFWRAGVGQQRPAIITIDDLILGYDFNVANTQFDSELPLANIGETAVFYDSTSGPDIDLGATAFLGTLTLSPAAAGSYSLISNAGLFANGGLTPSVANRVALGDGDFTVEQIITTPGDFNLDGSVGQDDLNVILTYWGQSVATGDWSFGDYNADGTVGQDDLNVILSFWGSSTPPSLGLLAVPEPASLGLLMVGGVIALARRR